MLRANHAVRLGLRSASRNPELAFGKGLLDALGTALPAFLLRPAAGRLAALALLLSAGIVGGLLIELLVRLVLVRAAAFGDGATAAFAHAAALLARRLGACLVIVLAFGLLQLVVATL